MTDRPAQRCLRRRTMVRVLSLALIVATWRGPVPCVHVHGNLIETAMPSLARHVRAYHDSEPADRGAHWHFHLVPAQDFLDHDDPSNQDVPDDPLLSQRTVVQLSDSSTSAGQWLEVGRHAPLAPEAIGVAGRPLAAANANRWDNAAIWRSSSYLTTLLQSAPLCAITGVALC